MNAKESLSRFIDAVVSGDEDAQKASFAEYTNAKTKELLGIPLQAEQPVQEDFCILSAEEIKVLEAMLGDDISLDGNNIFVKGKRVGRLEYGGEKDEFGEESQLYFVTLDGTTIPIKDNDLEDLVKVISAKFLGVKR